MNEDKEMDLLDLDVDDGSTMDALPEVSPFASPRPRKPWLLLGIGLLIIILATYIIVRAVSRDNTASVDVDLDAPAVVVDGGDAMNVNPNPMPTDGIMPPTPGMMPTNGQVVQVEPVAQMPSEQPQVLPTVQQPVEQPKPQVIAKLPENDATRQDVAGVPVRVVADRKEVTFNPNKVESKPAPAPKKTAPAANTVKKTAPKPQVAPRGSWYVQFGSYSTRALAESAQRQIQRSHASLFNGHQFVILAAVLPNGQTVYRLRIAFASSDAANGFCRNAKSDGLDCYVAK